MIWILVFEALTFVCAAFLVDAARRTDVVDVFVWFAVLIIATWVLPVAGMRYQERLDDRG